MLMTAPEKAGKTDAERLAELLAKLKEDVQPDEARYAELILEQCPRLAAGNVLTLAELMAQAVKGEVEDVTDWSYGGKVVMRKAHVPTSWAEYPNGRVGLDAVGNIAEVHLDDAFEVE